MSKFLNTAIDFDLSTLQTRTYIHQPDPKYWPNASKEVVSSLLLKTGDCSVHSYITAEETKQLIANLQQHLENIKTCELELLAEQNQPAVPA